MKFSLVVGNVVKGNVSLICLLVGVHHMAVAECAASNILATDTHVVTLMMKNKRMQT